MKAIRLSNNTIFVTDGLYTVRLLASGECGASPMMFFVLEWELQRDRPFEEWDYLSEQELKELPNGGFEKIQAAFAEMYDVLGFPEQHNKGEGR